MAKKEKEVKTNAMRILDRMKITYTHQSYECAEFVDGMETAKKLGLPFEKVYKTLVTVGSDKQHYVFVLPIESELDLKKAAKAAGVKSIAMVHVAELLALSGYVRGGCTAVGMKKQFPAFLDVSAQDKEKILVSGGRIGLQMELAPGDLLAACGGTYAELT